MIVESIRVDKKSKKIKHFTSSGVKEIKTKNKGNEAISEGLAYVNNYMTENNFKLINVTTWMLEPWHILSMTCSENKILDIDGNTLEDNNIIFGILHSSGSRFSDDF